VQVFIKIVSPLPPIQAGTVAGTVVSGWGNENMTPIQLYIVGFLYGIFSPDRDDF